MTWTAPEVTRVDEPFTGDERATLEGFLDWQRSTLLFKCAGLTGAQLAEPAVPPSNLSLLGLVRHMTEVERSWFRRRVAGETIGRFYVSEDRPDADFDQVDPERAEADFGRFTAECDAARQTVADLPLEHQFTHDRWGRMSLRWVFNHMIEEYARHNGHADLLRERIDGTKGS